MEQNLKNDDMELTFVECDDPIRLEDAEQTTVSINLKGELIHGTGNKEDSESSETSNGKN